MLRSPWSSYECMRLTWGTSWTGIRGEAEHGEARVCECVQVAGSRHSDVICEQLHTVKNHITLKVPSY